MISLSISYLSLLSTLPICLSIYSAVCLGSLQSVTTLSRPHAKYESVLDKFYPYICIAICLLWEYCGSVLSSYLSSCLSICVYVCVYDGGGEMVIYLPSTYLFVGEVFCW